MEAEQYGLMAGMEDGYWWYRALREKVVDHLGEASSVLDAGCGTGGMLAALGRRGSAGIDISPVALGFSSGKGLKRLVRGRVDALPFPAGTFDAVLSLDVLYHRGVSSDRAAVAESARVLKPGGLFIAHAPALAWLKGAHDEAVHGARRYTLGEMAALLEESGLSRVHATYRNLAALPLAVLTRKIMPGLAGSEMKPIPQWLDSLLYALARAENRWTKSKRLPLGLSVFCVAKKPL